MFDNSIKAYEEACEVIPGGVDSPVRAFKSVGGTPPFIDRGEGAYLFDIDNNKYLDFVQSWGPLICGHWYYLLLANNATSPIIQGEIYQKMLDKFGDEGYELVGVQSCKVCGEYLNITDYDENGH